MNKNNITIMTKESFQDSSRLSVCISVSDNGNVKDGAVADDIQLVPDDIDNQEIAINNGVYTAFVGMTVNEEKAYIMYSPEKALNLLVRAVNNRTRERNYFKKYCELLDNEISEEEFDNEISNNEDEYVVPAGVDAPTDDVQTALCLSQLLKGIGSTDDFMSLFSFTDKSVERYIEGGKRWQNM